MPRKDAKKKYQFTYTGYVPSIYMDEDDKKLVKLYFAEQFNLDDEIEHCQKFAYAIRFSPGDDGVWTVSLMGMPDSPNPGMIMSTRNEDATKAFALLCFRSRVIFDDDTWSTGNEDW